MKSRIDSIEVGRVIDYITKEKKYSTFKTCAVDNENIHVVYNRFEVGKQSALSKIQSSTHYSNDTLIIERQELLDWVSDGIIKEVHW